LAEPLLPGLSHSSRINDAEALLYSRLRAAGTEPPLFVVLNAYAPVSLPENALSAFRSVEPPYEHQFLLAASVDCGKNDPELAKEMEKQFVDLLNEELKLQQVVAEEHSHHMNATLVEAKRQATQYQREAEKCNAATETCEEARERSEAAISKEKKLTALWEQRARELGWHDSRASSM
ncbi:hypothetical protein EJB05_38860, partial [Eragrostis curvula]